MVRRKVTDALGSLYGANLCEEEANEEAEEEAGEEAEEEAREGLGERLRYLQPPFYQVQCRDG